MAKYRLKGPDGSTYELTAPDNATPEQLQEVINRATAQMVPASPAGRKDYETWGQYGKDAARVGVGQGLALGFGDEITAGARYAGGQLGVSDEVTYDQALKEEREAVDRFREKNPVTSFGLELAGGAIVPGGAILGGAKTAKTLGGAALRGAGIGAGFGAVGGFGASHGGEGTTDQQLANRLQGGAIGGGVGAVLGGVLPVGATAARYAAGKAKNAAGMLQRQATGSRDSARRYLGERMAQSDVTPASVQRQLDDQATARQLVAGEQPIPNTTMIADVDDASRSVLRGINTAGQAGTRKTIREGLEGRQTPGVDFAGKNQGAGQRARMDESVRQVLGVRGGSLEDDIADRQEVQKLLSAVQFGRARQSQTPFDLSGVIDATRRQAAKLRDPQQRATLTKALSYFEADPLSGAPAAKDINSFDGARQALNELIDGLPPRGSGQLRSILRQFDTAARDVAAGVKPGSGQWKSAPSQNKDYFDALGNYGTRARLLDVAQRGTKLARENGRISRRKLESMTPAERDVFRKAYYEEFSKKLSKKTEGGSTDYTGELRKPEVQREIRQLSPQRPQTLDRLDKVVSNEAQQTRTNQGILGGSQTADKLADAADVQSGLLGLGRAMPSITRPISSLSNMVMEVARTRGNLTGRQSEYLAKELTSMNPNDQIRFLRQIQESMDKATFSRFSDSLSDAIRRYAPGAGGVLGGVAGRRAAEPTSNRQTTSNASGGF